MKILFFTDTHIRGTSPVNRKDNFVGSLEDKLQEIREITIREKVDFCLHGGDMFDRPDISPSIVREMGMILKQIPAPIYAIAGNHDIYGHNPITVPRTMLGLLDGLGVVKLINTGEKIILTKDKLKIQLTGQPFDYKLDKEAGYGYVVEKEEGVNYAIHLVHGLLLPKPLFGAYTLIESVLTTQADITLVGHYHRGFDKIIQIDGKYFVNPGSLVRLEATLSEIKRIPQVVLIELTLEGIDIKLIKLNSALPGSEVLDENKLLARDYQEKKMADFIQGIKEVGEFKAFDVQEILEMIAERQGIKEKVKTETMGRIGKAQEALIQDEII